MIYEAVKAKHPEITVIGTVGPAPEGDDYNKGWAFANALYVPVVDEHYYSAPEWFISHQYRYDAYKRNATQVYVGEYASWGNKMKNALAEAAYMTALERNGDVVKMASYAPLLAKEGFTQWRPDMIYFNNTSITPSVNYYVQQLFCSNRGDMFYSNVIAKNAGDSALAASCVQDSKTGDIILKLVNDSDSSTTMHVNLSTFKKLIPAAVKTELTGNADASNDFGKNAEIVPVTTSFNINKSFDYKTPARSLTVIRIKTKN